MRRNLVFAASAALTLGLSVVGQAGAASASTPVDNNPAGTVTLASGNSIYPNDVEPTAASASYVVYRSDADDSSNYLSVPSSGGTSSTLSTPDGIASPTSLSGSELTALLPADEQAGASPTQQIYWWNLANGTSGHGQAPANTSTPSTTDTYLGTSADGWISASEASATAPTVYDTPRAGGSSTTIGTATGLTGKVHAVTGPNGAVLYNTKGADYLAFSSGDFTPLNLGTGITDIRCDSVTTDTAGCRGFDSATDNEVVLRVPLAGTAATVYQAQDCVDQVAVTAADTGWGDCGELATVPTGSTTISDSTFNINDNVLSTGTKFVVTTGSTPPTVGIYGVSDATSTPSLIAAAGLSPLTASTTNIGPGRVAFADDETAAASDVWSRTLTSSGSSVSLGAAGLVGMNSTSSYNDEASNFGLSVSGALTGYSVQGSDVVTNGTSHTVLGLGDSAVAPQVSGNRVLFAEGDATGNITWEVYNELTGTTVTVPGVDTFNESAAALWGNYVVYFKSDGSVWREDLTSSAAPVQLKAPVGNDDWSGSVFTWGDEVGWNLRTDTADTSAFVNATAGSTPTPTALPVNTAIEQLSSNGVVESGFNGVTDQETYSLLSYNGATTTPIVSGDFPSSVAVDNSIAAWVGSDGLPRVAPLAHTADQPRYLGAGSIGTSISIGQNTWGLYLPTSAPLTTCAVTIRSGSTVVRTLSCDPTLAALGDVSASWDGKNSKGVAQRAGTYTWTLTATNSDGALLGANGAATPFAGSISAPGAKTSLSLHASSKKVRKHHKDTLSGILTAKAGGSASKQSVTLYANGSSLKSATTSGSGAFSFTVKPGKKTTYQVKFAGGPSDLASSSGTLTVKIKKIHKIKKS